MKKRTRNYPRTNFFWGEKRGAIVTSGSGPYKPEYIALSIQRKNFPFSSLFQGTFVNARTRDWDGTIYVDVMPMSKRAAIEQAKKIRNLGGLARVTSSSRDRKGKQQWMVWFNPNGSMPAFDYVSGW
jgi:hypothetical protein